MRLQKIRLENFKNYDSAEISFSDRLNIFTGLNGAGKTSVLDAIYFLSSGKSYFNSIDQQLIKSGADYFTMIGDFVVNNKKTTVFCGLTRGKRKLIRYNNDKPISISDHYGNFPAIIIAPADIELVNGGSEERRRWIDSVISIFNHEYLVSLIKYEKLLLQRNAELKKAAEGKTDHGLLSVYTSQMAPLANLIHVERKQFFDAFQPVYKRIYSIISLENELADIRYVSSLSEKSLDDLFRDNLKKDLALERTSDGIHRDEMEVTINGNPLKKFGSQGQQKTFIFSLKLAQHNLITGRKNTAPLLLLDDVCERLDEKRLRRLFNLITEENFGQVFITDTNIERVSEMISVSTNEKRSFAIEAGTVMPD